MKINEIITKELLERYRNKHPMVRRYAHKKPPVAPHTIKPFYPPKPASIAPKPVTKTPNPLTTGSNPTVDMMKAPNFKLNDRNIRPEFTELDKKIAGIKSTH